ncbi:MAG: GNAT family N-acetyltransferase [Chloroflexia bacterium]|nr:GNAT family N-acetyltransferase [Chloroflexia bacterium]
MRPQLVCLHDKGEIEAFLRRNPRLHVYALGDLDDFFWPYTTWYARQGRDIRALVLVYNSPALPVLLALDDPPLAELEALLRALLPLLPRRFYAHLSPGLAQTLAIDYELEPHGRYHKMALSEPARLRAFDTSIVVPLGPADRDELLALYRESYPDNAFDPRMLESGQYFGLRRRGRLCSAAGIHVYSPTYRVAALGNITTHPRYRGQGLGTAVTAALCQSLLRTVKHIGLNVHAENAAAIACYEKLGFRFVAPYEEYMLYAK